eukprot:448621-Hanusia_phi.AAC.1
MMPGFRSHESHSPAAASFQWTPGPRGSGTVTGHASSGTSCKELRKVGFGPDSGPGEACGTAASGPGAARRWQPATPSRHGAARYLTLPRCHPSQTQSHPGDPGDLIRKWAGPRRAGAGPTDRTVRPDAPPGPARPGRAMITRYYGTAAAGSDGPIPGVRSRTVRADGHH